MKNLEELFSSLLDVNMKIYLPQIMISATEKNWFVTSDDCLNAV